MGKRLKSLTAHCLPNPSLHETLFTYAEKELQKTRNGVLCRVLTPGVLGIFSDSVWFFATLQRARARVPAGKRVV